VAGNALVPAQKAADAARASAEALKELEGYLRITAPFQGTITERYVHPGALAGPASTPLPRLEQASQLRLVVAVPESEVAGIVSGARVPFSMYPEAQWYVDVKRGSPAGDLVEVFGPLDPGATIVRRGSDEIREGTQLK